MLATVPAAHEILWDATNAVSFVYAPGERWQDGVVHIATYTRHVNLGFNRGAALADPAGVLRGSGRSIRHVPFASPDAVTAAGWFDDYLDAALAQDGLDRTMGDGVTEWRASKGPKRRPA